MTNDNLATLLGEKLFNSFCGARVHANAENYAIMRQAYIDYAEKRLLPLIEVAGRNMTNDKAIEAGIEALHETAEYYYYDNRFGAEIHVENDTETVQKIIEAATPHILASQWQDISTAPRDGRQIIVDAPQLESGSTYAYWEKGAWRLAYDGKPFGLHVKPPTHWTPLPNPPQTPSAESEE